MGGGLAARKKEKWRSKGKQRKKGTEKRKYWHKNGVKRLFFGVCKLQTFSRIPSGRIRIQSISDPRSDSQPLLVLPSMNCFFLWQTFFFFFSFYSVLSFHLGLQLCRRKVLEGNTFVFFISTRCFFWQKFFNSPVVSMNHFGHPSVRKSIRKFVRKQSLNIIATNSEIKRYTGNLFCLLLIWAHLICKHDLPQMSS